MEYNGRTYYHCFTAGTYGGSTVSAEDVARIADEYDVSVHMAPVWVGHPSEDPSQVGQWEPKALGWVGDVIAIEDKLYISFDHVGPEFRYLVEDRTYQYVSVELAQFDRDGLKFLYLYAVGLTNRPAVTGLPPLYTVKFRNNPNIGVCRKDYTAKYVFEKSFNKNENNMNQYLIMAAKSAGINTDNFTTESSLAEAIKVKFEESKTSATPAAAEEKPAPAVDPEVADLSAKVVAMETERAEQFVDSLIREQKILPAQRDTTLKLAMRDIGLARAMFAAVQPVTGLTEKTVQHGSVNFSDPKFKDAQGGQVGYDSFLKMSPADQSKFTDEEVTAMRERSLFRRN